MIRKSKIVFPEQWVDSQAFEKSLHDASSPHEESISHVFFDIPAGCKIMVDSGIMFLSLANQLRYAQKHVTLNFEEGEESEEGTYGYLNRIGFFDHLDPEIEVVPDRPSMSKAQIFRGGNTRLVEIERINPNSRDQLLPSRLTDALEEAFCHRPDYKSLSLAAFTVLSELIDNIFQHSSTELDGFAVLQVYKRGVKVAVSDSGKGIIETLRPSLRNEFPRLKNISDTKLVVEAFRAGLSRHGRDRGCGLKRSAEQAIKFNAILDVRLPSCRVHLEPSLDGYAPSKAYCYENIPILWGTHICFDFILDN